GWLAFVDYGTALSPVYAAHRAGKKVFVYVDETRPRSQGARLTAWELKNEDVPHVIIPDNAGAHLMSQGKVDMMIVGSDRIAANGDAANKIGTFEKALAAKEFNIPFYVAAPTSTIDLNCKSGKDIPIEERSEDEVLYQTGPDETGQIKKILVCSPGSKALNPAFDVTPAKYIKGIITEKGIVKPEEISKIL
ncbi:s-methyl-5-thioribose-1-phosphate isomerase, partial [Candidatus Woesearchaeota archaeon]|nr:s-methyl-5-thioribose-1-phosphate isomerase [Candidatus Woesearchaeota archaeon]